MKRTFPLIMFMLLLFNCSNEEPLPPNTYEITVDAKGVVNGLRSYINVVNERRSLVPVDTAIVMNETFTFRGKVENPTIKLLSINSIDESLPIIIEPGRTYIELNKDDIFNSKIDGSKNNELYSAYKAHYFKISEKIDSIKQIVRSPENRDNRVKLNELKVHDRKAQDSLRGYVHDFIAEHPKSIVSLLLLESQLLGAGQNLEKMKSSFDLLKGVINKNDYNKFIGRKIKTFIDLKEAQANVDIGKIAPNFTSPDPDGNMVSLNDIKGKATIIDFWASWCGPCRRENPNVVKVYEKYHDKGLEIISVSLDKPGQKDRWLRAIADDNLTWHHVGSLQYFNDPVARMYNINAIPATFILDADGRIVAKKLRGQALENAIAQLLN